ncbi:DeoR family transcriptional regulator, partial [Actinomyces naeslundii]|uniref:DeoR family transcriptional regulator n=1 Tax=Actinomyces naeslundii TaxID=1655 RepID=UPI001F2FAF7A
MARSPAKRSPHRCRCGGIMSDSPHERRRTILRALSPTTVHSVQALSRLTGVSVITIRRDLTELAHEGLVTR